LVGERRQEAAVKAERRSGWRPCWRVEDACALRSRSLGEGGEPVKRFEGGAWRRWNRRKETARESQRQGGEASCEGEARRRAGRAGIGAARGEAVGGGSGGTGREKAPSGRLRRRGLYCRRRPL
jgi:hypothetical protein